MVNAGDVIVPSAGSQLTTHVSRACGSIWPGRLSVVGPAFAKSPVAVQPVPQSPGAPLVAKLLKTVPGGAVPYRTPPGTYGWLPPPTRKFTYGWLIVKAGEVSVPVLASPLRKLLTRPLPR